MANSGKLLLISEERSVFILMNEDGSYITKDRQIRYRNIGPAFEIAFINECYVSVDEKHMVQVLDDQGKSKFFFPEAWLDTAYMKIIELQELGILKPQK